MVPAHAESQSCDECLAHVLFPRLVTSPDYSTHGSLGGEPLRFTALGPFLGAMLAGSRGFQSDAQDAVMLMGPAFGLLS